MSDCIVGWCIRYVPRQSILSNERLFYVPLASVKSKAILSIAVFHQYIPSSFIGLGDKIVNPVTDWHASRLFCDYCSYSRKLFQRINLLHSGAFCSMCLCHRSWMNELYWTLIQFETSTQIDKFRLTIDRLILFYSKIISMQARNHDVGNSSWIAKEW